MTALVSSVPRLAFCFAKKAACTLGDTAVGDALQKSPSLFGGLLEVSEGQMAKSKVIGHEQVLIGMSGIGVGRRIIGGGERDRNRLEGSRCSLPSSPLGTTRSG
jgi:hypothetical protein